MFVGKMPNVTVSTGREAVFTCVIDNVDKFKVFNSKINYGRR
jgi:hypothetical protein